jgi:hypothetical protein
MAADSHATRVPVGFPRTSAQTHRPFANLLSRTPRKRRALVSTSRPAPFMRVALPGTSDEEQGHVRSSSSLRHQRTTRLPARPPLTTSTCPQELRRGGSRLRPLPYLHPSPGLGSFPAPSLLSFPHLSQGTTPAKRTGHDCLAVRARALRARARREFPHEHRGLPSGSTWSTLPESGV